MTSLFSWQQSHDADTSTFDLGTQRSCGMMSITPGKGGAARKCVYHNFNCIVITQAFFFVWQYSLPFSFFFFFSVVIKFGL